MLMRVPMDMGVLMFVIMIMIMIMLVSMIMRMLGASQRETLMI
jgi:hypothetical protein